MSVAFAVGVVVTVASAVLPARRASRIAADGGAARCRRRPVRASLTRTVIGLVITATGAGLFSWGSAAPGSPPSA